MEAVEKWLDESLLTARSPPPSSLSESVQQIREAHWANILDVAVELEEESLATGAEASFSLSEYSQPPSEVAVELEESTSTALEG